MQGNRSVNFGGDSSVTACLPDYYGRSRVSNYEAGGGGRGDKGSVGQRGEYALESRVNKDPYGSIDTHVSIGLGLDLGGAVTTASNAALGSGGGGGGGSISTCTRENIDHMILTDFSVKPIVHQCRFCSYASSKKYNVQTHVMAHMNIKPFNCSFCSYKSAYKKDVVKHTFMKHGSEQII